MSVTRNTLINSPFNCYRNNSPEDDSLNESKLVARYNNKDKHINMTVHFLGTCSGGQRRLNIQYNGNEILFMNPAKKAEVGGT